MIVSGIFVHCQCRAQVVADITQPMDLATMARKVKNKQYKSKREFKDDLDLIWSNCYKYNAAEVRLSEAIGWMHAYKHPRTIHYGSVSIG
jgi:Bromodomain